MIAALALAALLRLAPAPDTLPATIRGRVTSETTDAPLAGALVEVKAGGSTLSARADSAGRYVVTRVTPGRATVRAERQDHRPLEVEVLLAPGADLTLDLSLQARPLALAPVVARGRARSVDAADSTTGLPASVALARARALEGVPALAPLVPGGGERGGMPGQEPPDPADVLYVRGVSSEERLVLLDGAPVYAPFHLGGLLESFEPGVLGAATMYLGGAPARYDGGLSYIFDLSTRTGRGDHLSTTGGVDLLGATALAEGPLPGGARFLVDGRAVHGLGVAPLFEDAFPYGYREGLLRLDSPIRSGQLAFTGFLNRETVRLGTAATPADQGEWENAAASLRYAGRTPLGAAEVTAALTGFGAALPEGEQPRPVAGRTGRARFAADFERDVQPVVLRYGASYDELSARTRVSDAAGTTELDFGSVRGRAVGGYVEGEGALSARLRLRAGLRGDLYSADPAPHLGPRISLTWALSDQATLSGTAGAVHQYVRVPRAVVVPTGPRLDTLLVPGALAVGRATHVTLGLRQRFDDGFRLGLEGFFKDFSEVRAAGLGRAQGSGLDLWVRRDAGAVQGWFGYSLAWIWSLPEATPYAERFAGRHLLNAGVRAALGRWGDLDAKVAYGSGLPYTAIPLAQADGPSAAPASYALDAYQSADALPVATPSGEPYLRLDVGLSRAFTLHPGDRAVRLAPYVRVLNALDRRDALFYRYRRESDPALHPLGALPLIPVLGFQWSTPGP